MLIPHFLAASVAAGLTILGAQITCAQDYPTKPVRFVTTGTGSAADFAARVVAQAIAGPLGQQVIIDNRPAGVIPGQVVLQAPPDGHTILLAVSNFWVAPLLQKSPYDPVSDFLPISLLVRQPNILVVTRSLPVKTVKELIALAKARPGELNFSAGGIGGTSHLAGELFKSMAGVNVVRVPYSSNSQEIADLISGQVQMTVSGSALVAEQVKAGRLKALAVGSLEPSPLVPGVPPLAASGLPGFESVGMTAMFAAAKTPASVIDRLNQEVVRFIKTPEAKDRFFSAGQDTVGSTPAELAAKVKAEIARMSKVIKDAGIRVE